MFLYIFGKHIDFWVITQKQVTFIYDTVSILISVKMSFSSIFLRPFHTSKECNHIIKMSRLRVVDNSEIGRRAMAEGKPPKCIHVYNKKGVGTIGDKVLVAILGEKKKGILVGVKKHQPPRIPKFDTNNIVLIDDTGTPLGNRIHVPIPVMLRTILKEKTFAKGVDYTKILAIASRFV